MSQNKTKLTDNKNLTLIQESVLKTLAYYKAVKTPLTLVQVGRYLISSEKSEGFDNSPSSLHDIESTLEELKNQGIVTQQKGLYWLSPQNVGQAFSPNNTQKSEISTLARKSTWLKYIQLEKTSQRKINVARKSLKIFSLIPFIKGIFICGSAARKVSRPNSDIDFLVLTKKDRVWTVRFFLTIFSFFMGKKTRNYGSRKNKFCLNHYRTSSSLKLEKELQDLYSAQEYARMINVYSGNRIDRKFFKKNKKWMKNLLPNFNFTKLPLYNINIKPSYPYKMRKKSEKILSAKIGDTIEQILFYFQSKKIRLSSMFFSRSGKRVIANKDVIMFHLAPRAPFVLSNYNEIFTNIPECPK